jgi:hypothetical protein
VFQKSIRVNNLINNHIKNIDTVVKQTKKRQFCVLKARQFGMSTFIESLLFHDILFNSNKTALVIAHNQASTDHIFNITKRFYNNLSPIFTEFLFPLEKSNAKELLIETTKSKLKVTTAGSKNTARGSTYNYIHCSEVSFWENPREIMDGIYPSIDINNDNGNYIIFESTANGNNFFKELYENGLDNNSEILSLFYGWNLLREYSKPIDNPLLDPKKSTPLAMKAVVIGDASVNNLMAVVWL